jgi:NADPH:quinone reductase-like Zn-dependent oxidoreductase
VDVILDVVGAPYLNRNLEALAIAGRLFIIGYKAGLEGEINLGAILSKRLAVAGAGLRSRTKENKAQIVQEVIKNVWPEIEAGKVRIVIDEVFPLGKAAEAHHAMERSHFGKILLTC